MKISYYRIDVLLSVFTLSSAEASPPPYARTNNAEFGTVTTTTNGSITRAVCNNPPINLYDEKLIWDIYDFLLSPSRTRILKVVIFSSADPEFFMPQIDVHILSTSSPYKNASYSAELLGLDGRRCICCGFFPLFSLARSTVLQWLQAMSLSSSATCSL